MGIIKAASKVWNAFAGLVAFKEPKYRPDDQSIEAQFHRALKEYGSWNYDRERHGEKQALVEFHRLSRVILQAANEGVKGAYNEYKRIAIDIRGSKQFPDSAREQFIRDVTEILGDEEPTLKNLAYNIGWVRKPTA